MKCLEALFHLKARIYALFKMDFETIKVLKKWKKIDTTGSDSYAYFLIGFFYKKDNNCKEALKWFKKMLNGLPKKDLSICHKDVNLIFMTMFEIASMKFQQKEYQIAELILKECHLTFTNHKKVFTEHQSFREKSWEPFVGQWSYRFEKTKEILDLICVASKSDLVAITEAKLPDDLVKIVSILQGNRIRNFDFERSDPELEEKIKRCIDEGKCQETVVTFQTFFENMKLERDPILAKRPVGDAVLWKLAVFDTFCSYLFKFNMYDEALEFLHMAIQKIQAIPRPEVDRSVINHQFKMIRYLARSYCAIGDLKKSSHFMKLHKAFRENYDFLEKSDDFKSEEVAIISLKSFLYTMLDGDKEKKTQNEIERFYIDGMKKYGRSAEFAERFRNTFVFTTMQILYKLHQSMKSITDIKQAVSFAWFKLQTIWGQLRVLFSYRRPAIFLPDDK